MVCGYFWKYLRKTNYTFDQPRVNSFISLFLFWMYLRLFACLCCVSLNSRAYIFWFRNQTFKHRPIDLYKILWKHISRLEYSFVEKTPQTLKERHLFPLAVCLCLSLCLRAAGHVFYFLFLMVNESGVYRYREQVTQACCLSIQSRKHADHRAVGSNPGECIIYTSTLLISDGAAHCHFLSFTR